MWAAGSGGTAATALAVGGKVALMGCIDGLVIVETDIGFKPLSDVEVDESVRTPDGTFKLVISKDYGLPHKGREGDYILITTEKGSIVLTKEHIIGGKRADEWKNGDTLLLDGKPDKVLAVNKTEAVPSGDLKLGDGDEYIANGYVVRSMFPRGWISCNWPRSPIWFSSARTYARALALSAIAAGVVVRP